MFPWTSFSICDQGPSTNTGSKVFRDTRHEVLMSASVANSSKRARDRLHKKGNNQNNDDCIRAVMLTTSEYETLMDALLKSKLTGKR